MQGISNLYILISESFISHSLNNAGMKEKDSQTSACANRSTSSSMIQLLKIGSFDSGGYVKCTPKLNIGLHFLHNNQTTIFACSDILGPSCENVPF